MKKIILISTIVSILYGCGTFSLGTAIPQVPKTSNEQQLDSLECKDKARLAASTAERQVGAFLLGMTIIGAPAAFELDKSKQREVYKECMEGKRYTVIPPVDGQSDDPSTLPPLLSTSAKIDVPTSWEKRELTPALNSQNRSKKKTNTSGYTGVYWCKNMQKWKSQINYNCIRKHLGYFNNINDAYEAYLIAKAEYHHA